MSQAINLQETVFSVTVLNILSDDIEQVKSEINQHIKKNYSLFTGKSVVIEPKIELNDPVFLALLVEFLYQLEIIPVAIRTQNEKIKLQAEYAGLAVFSEAFDKTKIEDEKIFDQTLSIKTALIINNVRSGQHIYAKNRDLIVMGYVNPGAEVIADGNVHIYGKILGKVFAGASGLKQAKIFANNLNPEMLSIAGRYQLSGKINKNYKQCFVEVSLDSESSSIKYRKVLWDE
jgi:septum site-determining protein MinC